MEVGDIMKTGKIKINEETKVEYNEFGNVSRVENTQVLSEKQGELQAVFYYRIEKEAGLSRNDENGETYPVYCHIKINYENEMSDDTKEFAHKLYYPEQMAQEHEIDIEHITPISKEEYEMEMK